MDAATHTAEETMSRRPVVLVGRSPEKMRQALEVLASAGFAAAGTFNRDEAMAAITAQHRLLVIHGDRDGIVPLAHGEALFDAAPGPKRIEVLPGATHNDLIGPRWIQAIADWADDRPSP
jgi:fermentation-respiration switch protein FrsA (DUF1100 family)